MAGFLLLILAALGVAAFIRPSQADATVRYEAEPQTPLQSFPETPEPQQSFRDFRPLTPAVAPAEIPEEPMPQQPELPAISGGPYDALYARYGNYYGVDPRLIKAVVMHESSENPNAVNYADHESIGLGQVLCRPDGKGGCANTFNIDGWKGITRAALFDPETNIRMTAQILAWNLKTFGYPKGIAVYNNWTDRDSPPNGPFFSAGYVNAVTTIYGRLQSLA